MPLTGSFLSQQLFTYGTRNVARFDQALAHGLLLNMLVGGIGRGCNRQPVFVKLISGSGVTLCVENGRSTQPGGPRVRKRF